MHITGVGINAHPDHVNGQIEKLEGDLECFQRLGYDYVEIPVDAVDVIYCGRLNQRRMADLKALLRNFDMRYTVHAPRVLDLRDVKNYELQKELFKTCIAFTADIGANIFVYHYGRRTEDEQIENRLHQDMLELADIAANYGVRICVENIEIDPVSHIVDFVEKVGKENVGITYDFGHAFLAAGYFGFDFLTSVKMARPYIKHIHVTDNFGRYDELRLVSYEQYKSKRYADRLLLGQGDLHLPPGWGKVPFDAAFELLADYSGVFMLEYYFHRHRPYAPEILQAAKEYVRRHGRAASDDGSTPQPG